MTPKRADEVLDGGSLYWVIKGQIAARQKLLAFRSVKKNGVPHCGLVYDKELVPVTLRPRRAFQGWRYLEAKDAPPDLAKTRGAKGLPEALQRELAVLGLLLWTALLSISLGFSIPTAGRMRGGRVTAALLSLGLAARSAA